MKTKVYQKPTCSTCRTVLREMEEAGEEFDSINYYQTPLTSKQLKSLCVKMGVTPKGILRTKEPIYKDLNLKKRDISEDELLELMVAHPDLIQRPIIEKGKKAVLARPVELWKEILGK